MTAVVVPKEGRSVSEQDVIAHCSGCLAAFKVPKGIVVVDSLPKNPSGKLLKRGVRRRFEGRYAG